MRPSLRWIAGLGAALFPVSLAALVAWGAETIEIGIAEKEVADAFDRKAVGAEPRG